MEPSDFSQLLGPLAGTLPHAAAVLACFGGMLVAARIAVAAIRGSCPILLLGSWGFAMASFVAGCVAFQTFAWGIPPTLGVAVDFIGTNGIPLAAMLVLGAVTAAGIELMRPACDHAPLGRARPAEKRTDNRGICGAQHIPRYTRFEPGFPRCRIWLATDSHRVSRQNRLRGFSVIRIGAQVAGSRALIDQQRSQFAPFFIRRGQ